MIIVYGSGWYWWDLLPTSLRPLLRFGHHSTNRRWSQNAASWTNSLTSCHCSWAWGAQWGGNHPGRCLRMLTRPSSLLCSCPGMMRTHPKISPFFAFAFVFASHVLTVEWRKMSTDRSGVGWDEVGKRVWECSGVPTEWWHKITWHIATKQPHSPQGNRVYRIAQF
jgi:hypothetical protein